MTAPVPAPTVALVGSMDTKAEEYAFVRDRLRVLRVRVLVIDTGVLGTPGLVADITREDVARAAGVQLSDLIEGADRAAAAAAMGRGASIILADLRDQGRIHGAFALGGTGGTSLASRAFRCLPLGIPKLIVSTAASGDTTAYIGESDLVLFPSVVDVAGLNRVSRPLLANAAAAMAGMLTAPPVPPWRQRPLIAASMFGVTTPGVTRARGRLEELGYEVVVFHMTGTGGRAMEALIREGLFAGVLDLTTTELADELLGGAFSAGGSRLTAAADCGIPQVVSVGALDMVNFGARESVPARFRGRRLHAHNTAVTLMRTTTEENRRLGRIFAARVAPAGRAARVVLPLGGISALDAEGGAFRDPLADGALFAQLRAGLTGTGVEVHELTQDINHPYFADTAAELLHDMIVRSGSASERTTDGIRSAR